jgi:N-acetyl-gamma-glutamyl-phosphate reductase
VQISFTPTLAPMPRGILTTATARVAEGVTAARLREAWEEAYVAEQFVTVLPEGQWPATKSVAGSNHAQLQLVLDPHAGRVVVTCVIDNLVKGTAGGAVQSLNLALGLPEDTGLPLQGVAP